MFRSALSDPALREEQPVLRDLERIMDDPTTTRTQAALLGAIVARKRGRWAQVEASCLPLTTPSSGTGHAERAYAWFLIAAAADARHRWQWARAARRRARRLITAQHALWVGIGIGNLEQAIHLRRGYDAAAVRRWLGRSEHRVPPPASIQYRLDLAWLESCTLRRCPPNRGLTGRLHRAIAALTRGTMPTTSDIRTELVRLLRIAVAIGVIDVARQILSRLDYPTRPPDDRPAQAVAMDILGGQVAIANGQLESALRRYTTATVGFAMLAADDQERGRLQRELTRLETAVHRASRHEPTSAT